MARAGGSGEEGRRGEDEVGAANLGSEEGAARRERHSQLRRGAMRRSGEDW